MSAEQLVTLVDRLDPIITLLVLVSVWKAKELRSYPYLVALVSVRLLSDLGYTTFLAVRPGLYKFYFYTYWTSAVVVSALSLLVVYGIFRLAMAPLKGLQTLGVLVFRWAAAISIALALGMAVAPHEQGLGFVLSLVTQFQRTSSVLTLGLLLFVCFAIRPMGLSFRSRIFGVSLGLGFSAAMSLIMAAWFHDSSNMYSSTASLVTGVAGLATLLIWSAYFALPEPTRRLIILPTTSPFLRWNQISEVLGDEPGYVAVAGIPPELFAPAEIEIMRRASLAMSSADAAPSPEELMTPDSIKSLSA